MFLLIIITSFMTDFVKTSAAQISDEKLGILER
jgi:hypothetical protein